jgi:polar amino acid transport system substrate-binding protein
VRRAFAIAAALVLTACAGDAALPSEITGQAVEVSAPATTVPPQCSSDEAAESAVRSFEPLAELPAPGQMPSGSKMAEIQDRGRLIAGVSGDTLLFGARNSLTGQIEGFDIDMINQIATAIFGPDDVQSHIEYRVITYADRLPSLESGAVDIVAHTMTINCNRWLRINFSSEYFTAGQKVLVKKGSGITDITQLADQGLTVCAPEGSTNIDEVRNGEEQYDGLVVIGKPDISDCLVAMQQGEADATTGDDTVLAGFAAQDPNTEVVGDAFTSEPYGLGFNKDDIDLVQFANAVIAQIDADGTWADMYQRWLLDTGALPGGAPPAPPVPDYTRQR